MAGAFRIAEGYVEVTADESGYDRAMDRLKSRRNTVGVLLQLDDKDATARLDRFMRDRLLSVKVDLDQTALARFTLRDRTVNILPELQEAARRLAEEQLVTLTRDRTVRIIADLDTRSAADDLALLTRPRTTRITADADTRAAADDLALLTRNRTTHVRVDVDRSGLNVLSSIGSGSGGASGGLSGLIAKVLQLSAVVGSALPTLVSLGQAIIQMGPAAAIAAPAVLSLATAFAAVKLGTSGIGDAFKAAFAPATSSANTAATATHRVEDAQRSLAKAQQGVKDAEQRAAEARVAAARQIEDAQRSLKSTVQEVADSNRRAAEEVEQAERDLADAQREARQAQLALNDARKQAAEDLQDLNNRLADAQLNQRQAVLDLQDAQQNLDAVKAKGSAASQEEIDKAQLAYDKAVQNLQEQQTETERLQQQTTDANKAGVEGSKTVVDAKQKIADANRNVQDKTRALKDTELEAARTQQEGLQKVADAERAVADARAAAAKSAQDSARQIADAQQAAADAARSLAEAQNSGALAVNKTATALARLAPNAQAFVQAVLAQRAAWTGLRLDVQNALFAGLAAKFTQLSAAVLPSLHAGLTGTATILNTTAKNAANAVIELAKTGTLRAMFDGLNAGIRPLTRIPGQIITGLTQITTAASPAFARLTTAAGGAADRISKRLGDAFKSGAMEKAINNGITIAKQFGKVFSDAFHTVGNILGAAGKAGGNALGMIGSVFAELRKVTAMPGVQKAMTSIFGALSKVGGALAGVLGKTLQAVLPVLAPIADAISQLLKNVGPLLPLVGLLVTKFNPFIGIMLALAPIIGQLSSTLTPIVQLVAKLATSFLNSLKPVMDVILKATMSLVSTLGAALQPVLQALMPIVGVVGQLLAQLAPIFLQITNALLPLIPPVAQLAVSLLNLALQVITPLMPLIVGLTQLLVTGLAQGIGTLVPVITTVIGWLTKFTDAVTNVVKWIVDQFQHLYDVLVGHSIIPDLVNAIIGFFTGLWTKTKQIFTDLKNWVVGLWNSLWSTVRSKWDSFWSGLKLAISVAWTGIKNMFSGLKTWVTNTWSSLWNGAKNTVTGIFNTISSKIGSFASGMRTAFSNLKNALGTIWDGVKSKIGSPIKFVVGTVYNNGLRKMWNTIAGKISSSLTLPAISLGFNRGGVVPGSGNSDTVPAMLTPGERILSKQQVARLGGHRGIDAMLGQDHPTKTGGNPSRQEERRRYQGGTQHYASGGIVGTVTSGIGNAIGGAVDWAKDLVIGGLKAAAQKALSSLVRPLIARIPGGGFGSLLKGLSNKAVDGMLSFLGNEDKKAKGGPAVQRALAWVKTQNGLPYQWAGNGNPSWDCSGLMSAIESVIRGEKPHRRWATGAFVGNNGPAGWVRNLKSPFMIGITNAGVGHTAGTLAGMNVESSGGRGVHMGKSARGYNDPLFTSQWGFAPAAKYDSGGLLQPGATMAINRTGRPERVLSAAQTDTFEQLIKGGGASSITIENITVSGTFDFSSPASRKAAAEALVKEMKEALRKFDRERA